MELELRRGVMNYFETVAEATLCQEETKEAIVPDACPDILRIIEVCGQACLTGKQARDAVATVSGVVHTSILYLPETGGGLRHMEMTLPFTCQLDAPGLTAQGTVLASPRLRWAEARVLNPRKLLLRVDLAVEMKACQPCELSVCQGVDDLGAHGIHQLQTEYMSDQVTSVQEKPFTFSDAVDFGLQEGGEVLWILANPACDESKLIGTKLIFKGAVELHALLRDRDGPLRVFRQSMTFSQVLEISETGESAECEVRIALAALNCHTEAAAAGPVEVTLELLAQAVVRCQRPVAMLQDLYSTGWRLNTQSEQRTLQQSAGQYLRPQSVRELLETATMVRGAVDSWLSLGEVRQSREGEQLVLTVDARITALYLDDGEEIQSIQRTLPVTYRLDCPVQAFCRCWCACPGEVTVVPSAGGLEARFVVEFHCRCLAERKLTAISAVQLGDERTKSDGTQPSVVLRMAAPGERLWDIAKAYGITAEEIVSANELEEGELPTGRMLLIPMAR